MRAAFGDLAVSEDEYLVAVLDRRDSVRHQDRCAAAPDACKAMQDLRLSVRVNGGEGVVQDQDSRLLGDRTGQRGTLLLASGKGDAALADDRVVLLRKCHHVAVELRDVARLAQVVL